MRQELEEKLKQSNFTEEEIDELKKLKNESDNKSTLDKILDFLKDGNSKDALKALNSFLASVAPHPIWKLLGDITIALICISSVIISAKHDFIEKSNVQSLLALIIGAVIGSRFKSS